jgi:hypothetical protein
MSLPSPLPRKLCCALLEKPLQSRSLPGYRQTA